MPQKPLENPSELTKRAKALGYAIPVSAFLGSALLGFNAAQMASVAVKPFNRDIFRAVNRWSAGTWWGWCVSVSEILHDIRVEYSGDEIPPEENVILVANHQQMTDITFLMAFAKSKNRLGDMKWFVKDVLKYVPGVGWGLYLIGNFFVKRSWSEDQESIEQTFAGIIQDNIPVWLISFVEGTRITEAKAESSRKYAREKGHPEFQHVLLPRTKGFVASMQGLRHYIDAVYDVTIGYPVGVPSLWQFIKGQVTRAHMHVRRFPVAELPEDPGELSQWLIERFAEKDKLLDGFYRDGHF